MNEDNNERLARVFIASIPQIIVLYPYVWKHFQNQNWFVTAVFNSKENV